VPTGTCVAGPFEVAVPRDSVSSHFCDKTTNLTKKKPPLEWIIIWFHFSLFLSPSALPLALSSFLPSFLPSFLLSFVLFKNVLTSYLLDYRGIVVRLRLEARDFTLFQNENPDSWAHTASFPLGTCPSPEVKRPGFESYHSPPSSAEIRNAWT